MTLQKRLRAVEKARRDCVAAGSVAVDEVTRKGRTEKKKKGKGQSFKA